MYICEDCGRVYYDAEDVGQCYRDKDTGTWVINCHCGGDLEELQEYELFELYEELRADFNILEFKYKRLKEKYENSKGNN